MWPSSQPEEPGSSVWVNMYAHPEGGVGDPGTWGCLGLCLTAMVLATLCIRREGGISKLFSAFQSEECMKGEGQTRKVWPLAVPLGTPARLPRPQLRLLSVCQQLRLSCSVRGALWAFGETEEETSAATLRRGGGLAPRRLFISEEELGQVAAEKTQVRW